MAVQLARMLTPLVEEPEAIAFVTVGPADQQDAPLPMVATVAVIHRRLSFTNCSLAEPR
jgi:hypothetical protein